MEVFVKSFIAIVFVIVIGQFALYGYAGFKTFEYAKTHSLEDVGKELGGFKKGFEEGQK